jgi:hypothetical protein
VRASAGRPMSRECNATRGSARRFRGRCAMLRAPSRALGAHTNTREA